MNENSFGGLLQYFQLKAFTILSGSAGFPGGYRTSPVFFARAERRFWYQELPTARNSKRFIWPQITQITQIKEHFCNVAFWRSEHKEKLLILISCWYFVQICSI
jgi:hypothetical protein